MLFKAHPYVRAAHLRWLLSIKPRVLKPYVSEHLGSGGGGGRPRFVVDHRNGKVIYR